MNLIKIIKIGWIKFNLWRKTPKDCYICPRCFRWIGKDDGDYPCPVCDDKFYIKEKN